MQGRGRTPNPNPPPTRGGGKRKVPSLGRGVQNKIMKGKIMKKNYGFTLAEVLITLGIIGVVAAMTMPTLINQTRGAQYKTAFKKALSAFSQAVTLNVALDDWNFADLQATVKSDGTSASSTSTSTKTLDNLLQNRMNVVKLAAVPSATTDSGNYIVSAFGTGKGTAEKDYKTAVAASTWKAVYLNDGIAFFYNTGEVGSLSAGDNGSTARAACTSTHPCYGVIDVNGEKGPNKIVKCDTAANNTIVLTDAGAEASGTDAECTVSNPTDIYPVFFYDQTMVPGSLAARAVLYGK